MGNKDSVFHALTMRGVGLASQIISPGARVSEGFYPEKQPDVMPQSKQVRALWDTGATATVISKSLAGELKLPSVGKQIIAHANGKDECDVYIVNVYLPNGVNIVGVRAAASELAGIDMLIGMNIITLGDFAITNKDGITFFSFKYPSSEHIDYVEQLAKLKSRGIGRNDPCWCGSGKKFKDCHDPKNIR